MNDLEMGREKAEWRGKAKLLGNETAVAAISPAIVAYLLELPEWKNARHVMLYHPLPREIDILQVTRFAEDRTFYLPRCEPRRRLSVHHFVPGETALQTGPFGLREPDPTSSPEVDVLELDLVVVPALLYSERCERLGHGGGYYDRFLPRLRPDCVLVGVSADALVVPRLPTDHHDVLVDVVVTERRTIRRAGTTEPIPLPD